MNETLYKIKAETIVIAQKPTGLWIEAITNDGKEIFKFDIKK